MVNFKTQQAQTLSDVENNIKRDAVVTTSPNPTLMDVLESNNVKRAWQQVKANHGSAGVDGISISNFPEYARKEWDLIRSKLLSGKYYPDAVLQVLIPKRTGGSRALGIPTVGDRVIQQAIAQVLTPVFDPAFSEYSYGFRTGKSAHDAAFKLQEYKTEGYNVAVEVDLKKFFDNVNHDILMHLVAKKVTDKPLLRLIGKYLRAKVQINKKKVDNYKGVPQGSPLSPLLSNIVLDVLDKELESRGHKFVRYADDFVILVKSEKAGIRVLNSITNFLHKQLKLPVNENKSSVSKTDEIEFLGFTFKRNKIQWTKEAQARLIFNLKKLTKRSWGVSLEYRTFKLNQYIRGWVNYFGIAEGYNFLTKLDAWLRRRLRACIWKSWRYVRTKVKNLTKLGIDNLDLAIKHAISRKAYWRLSKTIGAQLGLNNKWFKEHNLCSMKDIWIKIHYST